MRDVSLILTMQEKEFEHIFKCYYSDIYNFIYHYIMDGDDAEDLAQDVFIRFFEKYKSLPEEVNSKQYLLSIAKTSVLVSYATRMSLTEITSNTLKPYYSVPPQSTTPRMMICF